VYAASEGLHVVVLDCRSYGGQAGASARIENYLGFPTGISGQALAGRAYVQALKFGVEMMIPSEVVNLDCGAAEATGALALQLRDGRTLRSRTVVIASGARYRRPELPRLADFEGRGVWYWASQLEAKLCAGEEVVLVGGGNSAGQAAVFLAQHARKVLMLVRGPSLAASMSRYLIERLEAAGAIELRYHSEVTALHGDNTQGLTGVTVRDNQSGKEEQRATRNVFLFVGADPETSWLEKCEVALDGHRFVRTGKDVEGRAPERQPLPLETAVPGVFAVGDVRCGSVKRVGGAIGEGAAAVAQIHQHLAQASSTA
jgi:thioredoxin reductase (NADPH)